MFTSKLTRRTLGTFILLIGLMLPALSMALESMDNKSSALVVAVSIDASTSSLSKKQIIDIYMGRFNTFPNGDSVTPVDSKSGSPLKQRFYNLLVGKSERKISAYWSRLLFSGRATPPISADSIATIQKLLTQDPNAIGYLHESDVTQEMKIVYRFD